MAKFLIPLIMLFPVLGISAQQEANPNGIEITGKINDKLSSEYFGYVEINIANKSDKWHKLSNVRISFPDSTQNANIGVTLGNQLGIWYQAQRKTIEINEQNEKVTLAVLGTIGAGIAAFTNSSTLRNIGGVAALGSMTALTVGEIGKRYDSLQMAKMIPDNHLLMDTTIVPPGLFADRWILLNSKAHDTTEFVTDMFIEYKLENGSSERKKFQLREKYSSGAKWQNELPPV